MSIILYYTILSQLEFPFNNSDAVAMFNLLTACSGGFVEMKNQLTVQLPLMCSVCFVKHVLSISFK